MLSPFMKRAHTVMVVVFIGCALVQVNDPDPWLWMGIYAMAAAITGAAIIDKVIPAIAAVLSTLSLSGAMVIMKSGKWEGALFESEEGREMMGLYLVAFWIGGIALAHLMKPGADGDKSEGAEG